MKQPALERLEDSGNGNDDSLNRSQPIQMAEKRMTATQKPPGKCHRRFKTKRYRAYRGAYCGILTKRQEFLI